MEQILAAQQITVRVVDLGASPYLGLGCAAALQVHPEDRWTALLLLSPIEEVEEAEADLGKLEPNSETDWAQIALRRRAEIRGSLDLNGKSKSRTIFN